MPKVVGEAELQQSDFAVSLEYTRVHQTARQAY